MYKHFGREVIASLMGVPATHADAETVYLKVYGSFMEALDAIDNGEGSPFCVSDLILSCM